MLYVLVLLCNECTYSTALLLTAFSGVDLQTADGDKVCKSKYAAGKGIGQVVISRNIIMAPGMLVLPFIMQALEKRTWFAAKTVLHAPFQVDIFACIGLFISVATQRISLSHLS